MILITFISINPKDLQGLIKVFKTLQTNQVDLLLIRRKREV